ncbi:MAG: hypothetical protein IPM24_04345 [Bryobacterales bacterium]|nr:hypothetical protein [Bryobacterales bacterium]
MPGFRQRVLHAVLATVSLAAASGEVRYTIATVAGGGLPGDGVPAASAQFGSIQGIAADRAGNLYIADTLTHRVRRVNRDGLIETVAGTGFPGFSGDGGPARQARLHAPYGLVVDGAGTLYIADLGNRRVRRITPDGTIQTFAGGDGSLAAPRNLALDWSGALYIADFEAHAIRKVTPAGVMTTAASSGLSFPAGLAVDGSGALYVADSGNHRVLRIAPGGAASDLGPGALNTPTGLALGPDGAVYVADSLGNRVVRIGPDGQQTVVVGAGSQTSVGWLDAPRDVAFDRQGTLYIADGRRVRRWSGEGTHAVVAGDGTFGFSGDGGPAVEAQLNTPSGLALAPDGSLYIADRANHRVRRLSATGTLATFAGTGAAGPATGATVPTEAAVAGPAGLSLDSSGTLWIAESAGHRIRKVTSAGLLATAAGTGTAGFDADGRPAGATALSAPSHAILDGAGNLYIADSGNHRVRRVGLDGTVRTIAGTGAAGFSGDGGPAAAAQLRSPSALAFDSSGNLYIADTGNNRIRRVAADGTIRTYTGHTAPLSAPRGLAVSPDGTLFIADSGHHRVLRHTPAGEITEIAGRGVPGFSGDGGDALSAHLDTPAALALDSAGALYVADSGNNRVRRIAPRAADPIVPPPPVEEPPPGLRIVPAAGLHPGPIAPGQLVSLFGESLGPETPVTAVFDANGILPARLGGVEVRFNGRPAPLLHAQSGQINAQAPYTIDGAPRATVEVWRDGRLRASAEVEVQRANPALFTLDDSSGAILALNGDNSLNFSWNGAAPGSIVTMFATGEGQTDPPSIEGRMAAIPLARPVLPVSLLVGGQPAEILYAGAAPGLAGILQVNARVPRSLAPGPAPVSLSVGSAASRPGLTIQIR